MKTYIFIIVSILFILFPNLAIGEEKPDQFYEFGYGPAFGLGTVTVTRPSGQTLFFPTLEASFQFIGGKYQDSEAWWWITPRFLEGILYHLGLYIKGGYDTNSAFFSGNGSFAFSPNRNHARHQLDLGFGAYSILEKVNDGQPKAIDQGLMLTVGYQYILESIGAHLTIFIGPTYSQRQHLDQEEIVSSKSINVITGISFSYDPLITLGRIKRPRQEE